MARWEHGLAYKLTRYDIKPPFGGFFVPVIQSRHEIRCNWFLSAKYTAKHIYYFTLSQAVLMHLLII